MIVFDASTLILLARADFLDAILDAHQGEVTIPKAVEAECLAGFPRPDAVLIGERIRERRIRVETVRGAAAVNRLSADFQLGRGEAEALALAVEKNARGVATDDRHAIRACKLLRLQFTTAIGLLIGVTEQGSIPPAEAVRGLERLASYGRYQPSILEDARRRLGGKHDG